MPSRRVAWKGVVPDPDSGHHLFSPSPPGEKVLSIHGHEITLQPPDKTALWTRTLSFSPKDFEFAPRYNCVLLFDDHNVAILSTSSGDALAQFQLPATIAHLRILKHTPQLLITCTDETLRVWDLQHIQNTPSYEHQLRSLPANSKPFLSFAVSSDERLFAASFGDGQVILWSFPEFKELARHFLSSERLYFLNEGRTLVMQRHATQDLRLWYWESDRLIFQLKLNADKILDVSPDGPRFAVEAELGIRILDGRLRE